MSLSGYPACWPGENSISLSQCCAVSTLALPWAFHLTLFISSFLFSRLLPWVRSLLLQDFSTAFPASHLTFLWCQDAYTHTCLSRSLPHVKFHKLLGKYSFCSLAASHCLTSDTLWTSPPPLWDRCLHHCLCPVNLLWLLYTFPSPPIVFSLWNVCNSLL